MWGMGHVAGSNGSCDQAMVCRRDHSGRLGRSFIWHRGCTLSNGKPPFSLGPLQRVGSTMALAGGGRVRSAKHFRNGLPVEDVAWQHVAGEPTSADVAGPTRSKNGCAWTTPSSRPSRAPSVRAWRVRRRPGGAQRDRPRHRGQGLSRGAAQVSRSADALVRQLKISLRRRGGITKGHQDSEHFRFAPRTCEPPCGRTAISSFGFMKVSNSSRLLKTLCFHE